MFKKETDKLSESEWDEMNKKVKEKDKNCRIVHYDYFEDLLRILSGKILTIIDASIPDKQQNKCVKDLIKSEFYRRISDLQNFYWEGTQGHSVDLESHKGPNPLN